MQAVTTLSRFQCGVVHMYGLRSAVGEADCLSNSLCLGGQLTSHEGFLVMSVNGVFYGRPME